MNTLLLALLLGCGGDPQPVGSCSDDVVVDWDSVGQPLLTTWCTPCHSASVTGTDRAGAPEGLDFDTYASVVRWSEQILDSAGTSDRMPPVGGMSDGDRALLAEWITCGLPGGTSSTPAAPCASLSPAPADHPLDASLCDTYNALSGDLDVSDPALLSCLCAVEGDLALSGASGEVRLPLLASVGGSVRLEGSSATVLALPELHTIAGSLEVVDNTSLSVLDVGRLEAVGEVRIAGNGALAQADLSSVREVAGALRLERNNALQTIDLARLSSVDEDLVITLHPQLDQINNLDAIGSIGGHLEITQNAVSWVGEMSRLQQLGGHLVLSDNPELLVWVALGELEAIGGGVQVADNAKLGLLSIGRTLQTIAGPLEISGNAALTEIDPMPSLVQIDGALELRNNPRLASTPRFAALARAGGVIIEAMPALAEVGSFDVITGIQGDVRFADLPALSILSPFPVVNVSGDVHVLRTNVSDLFSLSRLQAAGALTVESNPQLTQLQLEGLERLSSDLVLLDNPQLVQISSLTGVQAIAGDLRIVDNPQLPAAQIDLVVSAIGANIGGEVDVQGNGS